MRKTKTEFLWYIADKYRATGERWPATSKDIAAWAIRAKLWAPHPRGLIEQCAHEIGAAIARGDVHRLSSAEGPEETRDP
jgi:hypothetical protein